MIKIKKYSIGCKQFMIEALQELQQHEQNLSDARKNSTLKLAEDYLQTMLSNVQDNNGEIFISFIKEQPAGFISYHYVNDDTVFETDDSNHYALISDICILSKYRNQGLSKSLFDTVFKNLAAKKFEGRVRLSSLADNEIANKTYLKYGFTPYEIIYEKIIGENL